MGTITKVNVDIDRNEVCRRLGYKGHSPPASTLSLIDSQITKAYQLIQPVYTYELKAIEQVQGQDVLVEGSLVFSSKTISYVLSNCKWGAIYLATIGNDLDDEITRIMDKGEMLEATILDFVGTEAAAQTLFKLRNVVKEIAKKSGCQATVQYAPGYCDWDVSQQKILFQAIDSASLGVRLTQSCLMIPHKSVSGIIGIGTFDTHKPPPCLTVCNKRASCAHKRVGWDPEERSFL